MEATALKAIIKGISQVVHRSTLSQTSDVNMFLPVVANVMLSVFTPQKDGLKLWWVVQIPPVKVEVRLRTLGFFVGSCQDVKGTNQLQTQCVFQCTFTGKDEYKQV